MQALAILGKHMSQKTHNYLSLALDDYRAARFLLREGLLSQGLSLASTAIEKQFKAILALKDIYSKKHLSGSLAAIVTRQYPFLKEHLEKDFIRYLEKGFDLRYASVDGRGYSIVINQNRTLIALDQLMLTIDSGLSLKANGLPHKTPLEKAIAERDPLVCDDNVAIHRSCLSDLSSRPNKMFELRVGENLNTLMAVYETEGLNVVGNFCKATDMDFGKTSFTLARG